MNEVAEHIYPLTICADRYGGTYSKGKYLAFNLDPDEVPKEISADDATCMNFWWNDFEGIAGKGETIDEAALDLRRQLKENAR